MNRIRTSRIPLVLVAALSLTGAAVAQTATQPHGEPGEDVGRVGDRLQPGANSFTETQVRERFNRMGFGEVSDLHKDDQGIWRGKAQHAGKTLSVGMDYKGGVAAE